jgi:hypothetical protein
MAAAHKSMHIMAASVSGATRYIMREQAADEPYRKQRMRGVTMSNPIPLNERITIASSSKKRAVIGGFLAAGLAAAAFANVCSARTDGTASAGSDAVEPSAATSERSGGLAVYPLLY